MKASPLLLALMLNCLCCGTSKDDFPGAWALPGVPTGQRNKLVVSITSIDASIYIEGERTDGQWSYSGDRVSLDFGRLGIMCGQLESENSLAVSALATGIRPQECLSDAAPPLTTHLRRTIVEGV